MKIYSSLSKEFLEKFLNINIWQRNLEVVASENKHNTTTTKRWVHKQ